MEYCKLNYLRQHEMYIEELREHKVVYRGRAQSGKGLVCEYDQNTFYKTETLKELINIQTEKER